MRARIKEAWILGILAAFGMTMAGERVEAGSLVAVPSKGISVSGGVTQGGDPQYTYYIDIDLVDDTIPAYSGTTPVATVTGTGITGLSSTDTYHFSSPYGSPPVLIGPPTIADGTFSVNFFDTEAITSVGSSLLLQLVIITPPDATGLNPGDQFTYSYTVGSLSGGGTVTLTPGPPPVVPEPSALALMLAGAAGLPYLGLRHRRRRRSGADA